MTKPITHSIEGLKELEAVLFELPKATAKNVGRRALKAGGKPIMDDYRQRAPRDTGELAESGGVSTKLSRRQARLHRKRNDRDHVEMFVGPGPLPQAVQQEFGNEDHIAQPALTPAWENNKRRALSIIIKELGTGVVKAAERLARKRAKAAKR